MPSIIDEVEDILENLMYFGGDDPPLPNAWVKGDGELYVVVGSNASGKSFFRKLLQQLLWKGDKVEEVIHISMQGRTDSFNGFQRSMIYGNEDNNSTGCNSARTVLTGMSTSRGRNHPHVLIWDEPDIGASEGTAAGMGLEIKEYIDEPPEHHVATVVISHSRALVKQLEPLNPHYICFGDNRPETLKEWLDRPVEIRRLQDVVDDSMETFRTIRDIINSD